MKKCFLISLLCSSASLYCPGLLDFKQLPTAQQRSILQDHDKLQSYFGLLLSDEQFLENFLAYVALLHFKELPTDEQMPIIIDTAQLHHRFGIHLFNKQFKEDFVEYLDEIKPLFGSYCLERLDPDLREKFNALKPHIDDVELSSEEIVTGLTEESRAIIASLDIMRRTPSQRLILTNLIAWQMG